MQPTLSYCVVNTNGRDLLLSCLDAIERHHPDSLPAEVLVLDNASTDGSAAAVRDWDAARGQTGREAAGPLRLIEREGPTGKAANDSELIGASRGRYCLLLNEDSELRPGAAAALIEALEAEPEAGAAGALLLDSHGEPTPCAWRFPGLRTAAVGGVFLHRRLTVQSGGPVTVPVDWAQSSALLVRREAAEAIGFLDTEFFVYYDECDFCKRLADAGWTTLHVPAAEALHHDQLSTDLARGLPRIVEFHRNRDLYMRKHHSRAEALAVRVLTAWAYGLRALAAALVPGRPARVYLAHARQALFPRRGTSIRDRVEHPYTEPR